MDAYTPPAETIAKVGKLIKDIKFAMLTTVGADGALRSRPMTTQESDFDGTLWFFTSADAEPAGEIATTSQVNVAYAAPSDQSYVSISGEAELSNDRAKMAELWSPAYKIWFEQGLDDPALRLIRIRAVSAEYWDTRGGKLGAALAMVAALVTGDRSKLGENESVQISSAQGGG